MSRGNDCEVVGSESYIMVRRGLELQYAACHW